MTYTINYTTMPSHSSIMLDVRRLEVLWEAIIDFNGKILLCVNVATLGNIPISVPIGFDDYKGSR